MVAHGIIGGYQITGGKRSEQGHDVAGGHQQDLPCEQRKVAADNVHAERIEFPQDVACNQQGGVAAVEQGIAPVAEHAGGGEKGQGEDAEA